MRTLDKIILGVALAATLAMVMVLTAAAAPGHSGDDVKGKECEQGEHVHNPHCGTASPTASPSATPTSTPNPEATPPTGGTVSNDPCDDVKGVNTHSVPRGDWASRPIPLRDPDCGQFVELVPPASVEVVDAPRGPTFTWIPLPASGFVFIGPREVPKSLPHAGN